MAYTTRNNKIRVAIVTLGGGTVCVGIHNEEISKMTGSNSNSRGDGMCWHTQRVNNKIRVAIVTLGGTVCDGIHNEEQKNTGSNSNSRGDSM